MSWNGSGVFTRIYSWVSDAAAGIDISSSRMDTDTNDITSNGFGNCLTRDGQGTATANLPMNGFKHTGVGNATASSDYVALGQLGPTGTLPGIRAIATLGDTKMTALPESLLATLAPGWYVCAGQTRPRTDPLWLATGAVSAANWVFGNGDGSTTYTLPDMRGRVVVGKDDMNGAAILRVTFGGSGITGTTLGASGGSQLLASHSHTVNVTDPGHSHTIPDPGHTHTVTDPGHTHTYQSANSTGGTTALFSNNRGDTSLTTFTSGSNTTGVTNQSATTGIVASNSGVTSITATTAAAGTGASANMPPAIIENIIIYCGA